MIGPGNDRLDWVICLHSSGPYKQYFIQGEQRQSRGCTIALPNTVIPCVSLMHSRSLWTHKALPKLVCPTIGIATRSRVSQRLAWSSPSSTHVIEDTSAGIQQASLCLGRKRRALAQSPFPRCLFDGRLSRTDISALRSEHRVCGLLAGTLPRISQQNVFLGVPLILIPEEVVLLVENGVSYHVYYRVASKF